MITNEETRRHLLVHAIVQLTEGRRLLIESVRKDVEVIANEPDGTLANLKLAVTKGDMQERGHI